MNRSSWWEELPVRDRAKVLANLRLTHPAYRRDVNCLKLSRANSKAHEQKKFEICMSLLEKGRPFLTEAIFTGDKRADVFDLLDGIAHEVVASEGEKSIARKRESYPVPVEVHQA